MHEVIRERVKPVDDARRPREADTRPPFSDYDLNTRPATGSTLRCAAVLVPLVDRDSGLHVLLTQRTDHLHDHAGQISFPGGRMEPDDADAVAAALRETDEEIGLASDFIEVVGCLDDYETVTGYRVTPIVSFVRPGFSLTLDAFEVADAFEVPLEFILDRANHRTGTRLRQGERRRFHVFEYGDRYIWGATAAMLMNLYRRVHGLTD